MLKKISVPLYCIRHTEIGGTEFAIYNLLRGLVDNGCLVTAPYGRDNDLSKEFFSWASEDNMLSLQRCAGVSGKKNSRFIEEAIYEWLFRESQTVLYPNYFMPPKRPLRGGSTSVLLHDVQYKALPQYHSSQRRSWLDFYLPKMFRSADSVFLISHSELELVATHFGDMAARKCHVIGNAIDWSRFDSNTGALSETVASLLTNKYILTVCHQFPHKNVTTLLSSFNQICKKDEDVFLYLAGNASASNIAFLKANIAEENLARVKMLGFVSDRDLGALYTNARLFVLPSIYEGFGMPAIEAMGHGVQTIVTNGSALPEVTLGRAQYIDEPLKPEAWTSVILDKLHNEDAPDIELAEEIRATYAPRKVAHSLLSFLA